ncbi:MAG: 3-deoxy-D-manno-octulosonic acid transferase [Terriglobales bacterium]|jgi:3-deoxy-D-manno-octulosonic-acid transferase
MYVFYSALLAAGLLLSVPYWLLEMLRHGKYRSGLSERLGRVPDRIVKKMPRRTIWIHAVSVGEVLAIGNLEEELKRQRPEYRIVVSTTTDTGQALARKRFDEENVFYFPLDLGFAIRPYLRALRPELVVIAETEFWPNFLRLAHSSGARIAIVNARVSDRSLPGYRRWRKILSHILKNVDLFLAQTPTDGQRLAEIGAAPDRIQVSGNLKYGIAAPAASPITAQLREAFERFGTRPVLVCGSTVDGEEALLLRAFEKVLASHPQAAMILAPRRPERFRDVARILAELNVRFWRRSAWSGEDISSGVLLLDTIGELASLYALADIAFVGGSLEPHGGHNILEPAQHGVAIVVGIHTANFRDMVMLFQRRNAVRVISAVDLPQVWIELIADTDKRLALGRNAAETAQSQTGATRKTVEALTNLLQAPEEYSNPTPEGVRAKDSSTS